MNGFHVSACCRQHAAEAYTFALLCLGSVRFRPLPVRFPSAFLLKSGEELSQEALVCRCLHRPPFALILRRHRSKHRCQAHCAARGVKTRSRISITSAFACASALKSALFKRFCLKKRALLGTSSAPHERFIAHQFGYSPWNFPAACRDSPLGIRSKAPNTQVYWSALKRPCFGQWLPKSPERPQQRLRHRLSAPDNAWNIAWVPPDNALNIAWNIAKKGQALLPHICYVEVTGILCIHYEWL